MIEQKKYTRRHMPVMQPRGLTKSADGFTATPCLSATDNTRQYGIPRVCYANASADACPIGFKTVGKVQKVGFNPVRMCDEYDVYCYRDTYPRDDASLLKCCLGTSSPNICDPHYCPGSQACRDMMLAKCDTDAGFLTPDCQAWMQAVGNEDARDSILSRRCSQASMLYGNSPCRAYCKANPGKCDTVAATYCATPASSAGNVLTQLCAIDPVNCTKYLSAPIDGTTHLPTPPNYGMGDPLCSCINSKLKDVDQSIAPVACFDKDCVATGYQTANMGRISSNCPSVIDCRAVINSSDQATLQNATIQQSCGQQIKAYNDDEQKAMLDAEIARIKRDTDAAKAKAAAESGMGSGAGSDSSGAGSGSDSSGAGSSGAGSSGSGTGSGSDSSGSGSGSGAGSSGSGLQARFGDATGLPGFGDLSVGNVLLLFIVLIIVLGLVYRQWKRKSALGLAQMQASLAAVQPAPLSLEQRAEIANLPAVGAK